MKKTLKQLNQMKNTRITDNGEVVSCQLYNTIIASYNRTTGELQLAHGGWITSTTANRINQFLSAIGLGCQYGVNRCAGTMYYGNQIVDNHLKNFVPIQKGVNL